MITNPILLHHHIKCNPHTFVSFKKVIQTTQNCIKNSEFHCYLTLLERLIKANHAHYGKMDIRQTFQSILQPMVPPSPYINPTLAEISPVLSMIDIYNIEYYLYSSREERRKNKSNWKTSPFAFDCFLGEWRCVLGNIGLQTIKTYCFSYALISDRQRLC